MPKISPSFAKQRARRIDVDEITKAEFISGMTDFSGEVERLRQLLRHCRLDDLSLLFGQLGLEWAPGGMETKVTQDAYRYAWTIDAVSGELHLRGRVIVSVRPGGVDVWSVPEIGEAMSQEISFNDDHFCASLVRSLEEAVHLSLRRSPLVARAQRYAGP